MGLSYLVKAPMVNKGAPVVNALFKQREAIVNLSVPAADSRWTRTCSLSTSSTLRTKLLTESGTPCLVLMAQVGSAPRQDRELSMNDPHRFFPRNLTTKEAPNKTTKRTKDVEEPPGNIVEANEPGCMSGSLGKSFTPPHSSSSPVECFLRPRIERAASARIPHGQSLRTLSILPTHSPLKRRGREFGKRVLSDFTPWVGIYEFVYHLKPPET